MLIGAPLCSVSGPTAPRCHAGAYYIQNGSGLLLITPVAAWRLQSPQMPPVGATRGSPGWRVRTVQVSQIRYEHDHGRPGQATHGSPLHRRDRAWQPPDPFQGRTRNGANKPIPDLGDIVR